MVSAASGITYDPGTLNWAAILSVITYITVIGLAILHVLSGRWMFLSQYS